MYKQKILGKSPIGIFLITVLLNHLTPPYATKSLKPLPSPQLSNLVT